MVEAVFIPHERHAAEAQRAADRFRQALDHAAALPRRQVDGDDPHGGPFGPETWHQRRDGAIGCGVHRLMTAAEPAGPRPVDQEARQRLAAAGSPQGQRAAGLGVEHARRVGFGDLLHGAVGGHARGMDRELDRAERTARFDHGRGERGLVAHVATDVECTPSGRGNVGQHALGLGIGGAASEQGQAPDAGASQGHRQARAQAVAAAGDDRRSGTEPAGLGQGGWLELDHATLAAGPTHLGATVAGAELGPGPFGDPRRAGARPYLEGLGQPVGPFQCQGLGEAKRAAHPRFGRDREVGRPHAGARPHRTAGPEARRSADRARNLLWPLSAVRPSGRLASGSGARGATGSPRSARGSTREARRARFPSAAG